MCRVFAVFLIFGLSSVACSGNGTKCNGFNANFDLQNILGTWYVVAIVPEAMFPDKQKVPCYEVDFSEIEDSGLRWLMNMTHIAPHPKDLFEKKGIYIRQRYHSEHSFDVWSKSIEGTNGCFQQVFSLNTDQSDISNRSTIRIRDSTSPSPRRLATKTIERSCFCERQARPVSRSEDAAPHDRNWERVRAVPTPDAVGEPHHWSSLPKDSEYHTRETENCI